MRFRGTHSWWDTAGEPTDYHHAYDISLKTESDQDFNLNRYSVEAYYRPIWTAVGIGGDKAIGATEEDPDGVWDFRFNPSIGADLGFFDGDELLIQDTSELRVIQQTSLRIRPRYLVKASLLDPGNTYLSLLNTCVITTEDSGEVYNYFSAILNFGISKDIGLALSYTVGQAAPSFEQAEQIQAAFSVKF